METKNNLKYKFSYFKSPIENVLPDRTVSLEELHKLIIGYKFQLNTKRIRAGNSEVRKKLKSENLDFVTFSGVFNKRLNADMIEHSGLIVFDIDSVCNVNELKKALLEDEYLDTALLFRSPSSNGLKWVLPIDFSRGNHLEWFESVANYIRLKYSVEVDNSGQDISRACFICQDPEAYLNQKFSGDSKDLSNEQFHKNFHLENWSPAKRTGNEKNNESQHPESKLINLDLLKEVEKTADTLERKQIDITEII